MKLRFYSKGIRLPLYLLITIFSLFMLNSCNKEDKITLVPANPINEAHDAFNSVKDQVSLNGNSILSTSLLKSRKALWEQAFLQKSGDTTFVFVPINLPVNLTLKQGGVEGTNLNSLMLLRLTNVGHGFDARKADMITLLPETPWKKGEPFAGKLIVENWFNPDRYFLDLSQKSKSGMITTFGLVECVTTVIEECIGAGGYETCTPNSQTTCAGYGDGGGGGGGGGVPSSPPPSGGNNSGGGSSSSSGAEPTSITFVSGPNIDLSKYFNCFKNVPDNGAQYSVQLRADLPVNTDPSKLVTLSTVPPSCGHAFITLTKTNGNTSVTQSFGFYPSIDVLSLSAAAVGSKLNDNGDHDFDASIAMNNITPAQFQTLMDKAAYLGGHMSYDINDYNCTDYALEVFNSIRTDKITVPDWIGPGTGINYGRTPNGLYNQLAQKKSYGDQSISLAADKAPAKKGSCN